MCGVLLGVSIVLVVLGILGIIGWDISLVFNKMQKWKCIRNILIVISFAIFVMQTYEAMIKYWKSPTVIINSETTWENIEKPRNACI